MDVNLPLPTPRYHHMRYTPTVPRLFLDRHADHFGIACQRVPGMGQHIPGSIAMGHNVAAQSGYRNLGKKPWLEWALEGDPL